MTFAEAQHDEAAPLVIPYRPRRHFLKLHASQKRWIFTCAHRRAGKTVALANQLIRAAYLNPRQWPPPRYGYVGPSFEQAKDLVWSYLKQYTAPIEGVRFLEGELAIVLPHNGAIIKLYGGMSAYERMRGMYFDGIVLDEYPLLQKTVFSTVVRPCLADYRGWAVVSGTSNGDDHFNHLRLRALDDERWDVFIIPLSETGEEALAYAEATELTQDMSPDEYAREMECFPPGSLVATSRGYVPIESIRLGDSVLTHKGRWRPVTCVMQKDFDGEMVAVTAFGCGGSLLSTPEHPWRVYHKVSEGDRYEWKSAAELEAGDCLFLPTPIRPPAPAIAPDLAALAAWYIAEGSVCGNNIHFSLNPKKPEEAARVSSLLTACGYEPRASNGGFVVCSVSLADQMASWCGSLAENKRIPFDIIGGHEELVFQELMLGDGCLSQPVQGGHCWSYTTISRGLAFDVQALAAMLGRRAGISARPAGTMVSPNNGKEYPSATSYQVRIPHGVNINHSKARDAWPTANGMAYRIREVARVPYIGRVFNLSVKEDESYVVEGRAVHNCSFDAPVEGAYFAESLNALTLQGRVCAVPVDLAAPVITSWDLGVHDYCSIWWWQTVGKELHFIDYEMAVGKGLDHWSSVIRKKALAGGYEYRCHLLPHDIEAREISSAKSRRSTLTDLIPKDEPIITVPRIRSKEDGIHAARAMLGSAYFDATKCKTGLAMLRGYHKSKMGQPVHGPGPHSHGADAFQTAAVGFHLVSGLSASMLRGGGPIRRKLRGLV